MNKACMGRLGQRVRLSLAALGMALRFHPVLNKSESKQGVVPRGFCFRRGEIRSIDHAGGELEISVRSGVFWVTDEAGTGDHVVASGRILRQNQPGRLVIEAVNEGCLMVRAV